MCTNYSLKNTEKEFNDVMLARVQTYWAYSTGIAWCQARLQGDLLDIQELGLTSGKVPCFMLSSVPRCQANFNDVKQATYMIWPIDDQDDKM